MKNFKRMVLIFFTCLLQTTYASICERTLEVQDGIREAIGKVDRWPGFLGINRRYLTCDEVTQNDLEKITLLNLRNRGIRELRSGDFEGLSNLQELILSYNALEGSIPTELGKLKNLRGLFLFDNELTGPSRRNWESLKIWNGFISPAMS